MELRLLGHALGDPTRARALCVRGQRTAGGGVTARQRRPSGHNPVISTTADIPSDRAAELVAAIGALEDRLEVAVDAGDRAALEQLRRRFERELSALLPAAA
jgi:hypothetical protein